MFGGLLLTTIMLVMMASLLVPRTPAHWTDLSWNPSSSTVKGYNVYRCNNSTLVCKRLNANVIPGTSYQDMTVSGGRAYYYQVTAVGMNGVESVPSNGVRVRIPFP